MPPTYATKQAADKLQVSPNTLRNWSDAYGDYLTESARPGAQPERRFTEQDLTVLAYVKQLRSEGMERDQIRQRLSETEFADVEVLEPDTTKLQQTTDTTLIASQNPPESQDLTPVPKMYIDGLQALQTRVEALEGSVNETKQGQRDFVQGLALGFIACALFFLLLVALAALYAR